MAFKSQQQSLVHLLKVLFIWSQTSKPILEVFWWSWDNCMLLVCCDLKQQYQHGLKLRQEVLRWGHSSVKCMRRMRVYGSKVCGWGSRSIGCCCSCDRGSRLARGRSRHPPATRSIESRWSRAGAIAGPRTRCTFHHQSLKGNKNDARCL